MLRSLTKCFTHHLGRSDQKAVIVTISTPHTHSLQGRLRFPASFLCDACVVESLTRRLAELPQQDDEWWDKAVVEIKATAFRRESLHHPAGLHEATALLHDASLQHTPLAARNFLEGKGLMADSPRRAYALLASYAEAETANRCGTQVLAKLKRALHTEPASPYEKQPRKLEIARLMRELQHWRRLSSLRDQYGTLLTEPLQTTTNGQSAAG